MEIFIFLLVMAITVIMFFRWFVIIIATVLGMVSGGFFAGLGVGLFTYLLLKMAKWITLGYLAVKAASLKSDQPEPKE